MNQTNFVTILIMVKFVHMRKLAVNINMKTQKNANLTRIAGLNCVNSYILIKTGAIKVKQVKNSVSPSEGPQTDQVCQSCQSPHRF